MLNKKAYDIANVLALILISTGLYIKYGVDSALIYGGLLILALNLIMLFVSMRKIR